MSVALPTATTPAYGTTSCVVSKTSGVVAGDVNLFVIGCKGTSNSSGGTVATPSGLVLQGSILRQGGWSGTIAPDDGNTSLYAFTRDIVGGEPSTYTFVGSTMNVMWGYSARLTKTLDLWDYGISTGARSTAGTDGGSWTASGTTNPDVDNGDCFLGIFCSPSNASDGLNWTSETLTIPGVTNAAATELAEPNTNLGNALGGVILGRLTSTGPSSGNPTMTGTTVKGIKQRGAVMFIRIRDLETPDNGGDMMQFFGPMHNDDELARRRSGLWAPKERELIVCKAA